MFIGYENRWKHNCKHYVSTLLLTGKQEWRIGYVANCKRKSNYAVSVTLLNLARGACLVTSLLFSKVGRSKPPPVLTSGFNRLKPPRSISSKVVNTGQYESEWSIEHLKGRFCGGLRYLYRFYVLSIEKRMNLLFCPCKGHFSW